MKWVDGGAAETTWIDEWKGWMKQWSSSWREHVDPHVVIVCVEDTINYLFFACFFFPEGVAFTEGPVSSKVQKRNQNCNTAMKQFSIIRKPSSKLKSWDASFPLTHTHTHSFHVYDAEGRPGRSWCTWQITCLARQMDCRAQANSSCLSGQN